MSISLAASGLSSVHNFFLAAVGIFAASHGLSSCDSETLELGLSCPMACGMLVPQRD